MNTKIRCDRTTNGPDLRIVQTEPDTNAIARLRYEVPVEEMHRRQDRADHQSRTIHEPIGHHSIVVGAFDSAGGAVGTFRLIAAEVFDASAAQFYDWASRAADSIGLPFARDPARQQRAAHSCLLN